MVEVLQWYLEVGTLVLWLEVKLECLGEQDNCQLRGEQITDHPSFVISFVLDGEGGNILKTPWFC